MKKQPQPITITDEQSRLLSVEYNRLFKLAQAQLEETKLYISTLLDTMTDEQWKYVLRGFETPIGITNFEYYANLIKTEVGNIKLGSIQVEPKIKTIKGENTISIIYEYPDALFAFFENPNTPEMLRNIIKGGIDVGEESVQIKTV